MKFFGRILVTIAAASFLVGPSVANAGDAFQGSDSTNYITNSSGEKLLEVCDNEADGYGVHGDFTFNQNKTNERFDETGGASSACDTKKAACCALQGLWRHRTVEERPAWNELDIKGDWHYHS